MRFLGKDPNIIDAYYTATAEGAITAGKPLIVEADGDVAQVATIAQAVGTPVVFESGNTAYIDSAYDSNAQKVVIAYQDIGNSSYGTAVVGTVDPNAQTCLLYTSPSPRDGLLSRMPSSA